MADNQKTAKGNVLFGLIIGLVIAVIAAVVAFGFMSKNNSPVQTDDYLAEQNQDRDRLNRGFDPNDSLQSKVPIKSFAQKNVGTFDESTKKADENIDNSNDANNSSSTDTAGGKIEQAKNKIVEVFDEFGDKKLATKKEEPAIEIDPDEAAMRDAKERKDAQKVADEAKTIDELIKQKKLQQEKAKEVKIKELERQDRLAKKQKEINSIDEAKQLNDPIDAIVSAPASTQNTNNSSSNSNRSKKSESTSEIKSSPAGAGSIFYVQTGAFRNIAQADQQKALLSMQGIQAKVSEVDSNGQTLHRVRLGPFNSRQDVQKLERSLEQSNLSYKVIKVTE